MEQVSLPAHIVDALNHVAFEKGFNEPEFDYANGSDKGFIGLVKRCHIKEKDQKLSVICKYLPSDGELNTKYSSYELFKREVLVYQKFLPEVDKIQLENGLKCRGSDGFWCHPKCFHSDYNTEQPEKSFILMEDLALFVTQDSFQPSDFKHTEKLFLELGKFHAVSFALRVKKPEVFAEFKCMNDLMGRLMTTSVMRDLAPRNCQLASELFNNPEELHIKNEILSYKNDLWPQMTDTLSGSKAEPYSVICHGDCWINNVMYEEETPSLIKNVRLVDWQMTRFGSVAIDLMYYLFCCCDKQLRDRHKSELLSSYHDSMGNLLSKLDIDVNDVFPFSALLQQIQKFGKFAFAMAIFAMPIICKYPEKLFDDKKADLTEQETQAVAQYNEMMKNVINDMFEMGIL